MGSAATDPSLEPLPPDLLLLSVFSVSSVVALNRLGCDLIVMGTHGRSWLKHRLFGSVTEEVVRRARCPVMVVKAPAHKAGAHAPQAPTKAEGGHAG